MIERRMQKVVEKRLYKGKAIVIIGPRQVGKTTLVKSIVENLKNKTVLWLNGDEAETRELLSNTNSARLKAIVGQHEIVVIDEAQRIVNIGLTLKLLVDNVPTTQLIVTGSSVLELADEINEPLTGRKFEYFLFPLSFTEMVDATNLFEEMKLLEHRMIFGYYPEIVTNPGEEVELLQLLSGSYLYKDILKLGSVKKPPLLEKILQALAFQMGNEVSYHELSQLVGADAKTVERYIDLLEKSYVVFRLTSFSRNLRNELKKSRKIYFYDIGIRNSIIRNFSPTSMRQDIGALWENFLISERMKFNQLSGRWVNSYFWRTHTRQEIDYIEEYDGVLHAYEFKWNPKKRAKPPKIFFDSYPDATWHVVTKDNFEQFIFSS